jgi:hypothetical protein
MHENHDRHLVLAHRHDETAGEHDAVTLECCLLHIERDALTRNTIEVETPGATIRKRNDSPVAAIGPAVRTLPIAIGSFTQGAAGPIELAPAEPIVVGWGDIDHISIGESIAANVTIRCIVCARDRRRCDERT